MGLVRDVHDKPLSREVQENQQQQQHLRQHLLWSSDSGHMNTLPVDFSLTFWRTARSAAGTAGGDTTGLVLPRTAPLQGPH